MFKYRVRIKRQGVGYDYADAVGPVPRVGDRVYVADMLPRVTEVIWTPGSVDDTVAEVSAE